LTPDPVQIYHPYRWEGEKRESLFFHLNYLKKGGFHEKEVGNDEKECRFGNPGVFPYLLLVMRHLWLEENGSSSRET